MPFGLNGSSAVLLASISHAARVHRESGALVCQCEGVYVLGEQDEVRGARGGGGEEGVTEVGGDSRCVCQVCPDAT